MNKREQRKTARKRIETLFDEAEKAAVKDRLDRADRYVDLARKIGMRYNVTIPSEFRRRFCKRCYSYLFPEKTCSIRVKNGMLVSRCKRCGTINRFKYKR